MNGYATKEEEKIGFSAPPMANQSDHPGQGFGKEVFTTPDERRAAQVR
jgi:hypothetical protein